jgi:hypothetical protein
MAELRRDGEGQMTSEIVAFDWESLEVRFLFEVAVWRYVICGRLFWSEETSIYLVPLR